MLLIYEGILTPIQGVDQRLRTFVGNLRLLDFRFWLIGCLARICSHSISFGSCGDFQGW
jgi:hypothetical protein